LGDNTTANAGGLFTGALAVGLNNGAGDTTTATSQGALSFAYANGKNASATTLGSLGLAAAQGDNSKASAGAFAADVGNVALALGKDTEAQAGGLNLGTPLDQPGFANVAVAAGESNSAFAVGGLNGAFSLGGKNNNATALGVGNLAASLGGHDNNAFVVAGDSPTNPGLSSAIIIGGSNNAISATTNNALFTKATGPFAIALSIGQTGKNVLQEGPGISFNK